MNNISVKVEDGLNNCSIGLIQVIERELDKVMVSNGFTRTTTSKAEDRLEFNYKQFGKAI